MIDVVVAACLLASPVPLPVAVGLAWSAVHPASATILVVLALVTAARQGRVSGFEIEFLGSVAAELRSGSSLRSALVEAGWNIEPLAPVVRLSNAGMPAPLIAASLQSALPHYGAVVATAVEVASTTGGRTARVFESLAGLAAEENALARELRGATVQARASAWVVGGLPGAFLLWHAVTGRLADVAGSSAGRWILAGGLGLLGSGVFAIWKMASEATK